MRVVAVVAFAALLLDSIVVTVHWWRGDLGAPGMLDWIQIGLLPVLLFIYLRHFSVLRPDCRACQPPPGNPPSTHPGP